MLTLLKEKGMLKSLLSVIMIICVVSGCSMTRLEPTRITVTSDGTTVTEKDPLIELEEKRAANEASCIKDKRDRLDKIIASLVSSGKSSSEITIALLAMKQSDDMKEMSLGMVQAFTGKSADTCSGGTRLYDAMIAEVQSKNKAVEKGVDGFFSAAKWGLAGFFISDTLKGFMDNAGQKVNFNNSGDAVFTDSHDWTSNWSNQRDTFTNMNNIGASETPVEPVL